jgi:hypothetical protein
MTLQYTDHQHIHLELARHMALTMTLISDIDWDVNFSCHAKISGAGALQSPRIPSFTYLL